MQDLRTAAPALTALSEEEKMFRDAVREFAETEVRPHVSAMDEAAQFRPDLIPKFFELGLMGIEVPEQYGGAGGGDLHGRCWPSRSWPGSTRRPRSTWTCRTRS